KTSFARVRFGEPDRPLPVSFYEATFGADVDFSLAVFTEEAAFWSARFSASAQFLRADFQWATFSGTTFDGMADFTSAKFGESFTSFNDVTFGSVKFADAKWLGETSFQSATFKTDVEFTFKAFGPKTTFFAATFKGYARFFGNPFMIGSSLDFQFL